MSRMPPPLPHGAPQGRPFNPGAMQGFDPEEPTPVFRKGRTLVAVKGAVLPECCIKCGGPLTAPQVRKELSWYSPIAYVGLLGGILPFAILAIVLQKKGVVFMGLCERHRSARKTMTAINAIGLLAGVGMIGLAIYLQSGYTAAAGCLVILGFLISVAITSPMVKVEKIDDHYVYLKSVPAAILDTLPDYTP